MSPRWRYLASFTGAVLVAALGWWLFPTDARRIRAACAELAESVSVPPREPDVARLARVGRLARYLTVDVVVEAEGGSGRIDGREQVLALAGRLPISPHGVTVTLDDVDVVVGEDRRSAETRTVATAREPDPAGGPDVVERRGLSMHWTRTEEGWRLAHVLVGPVEQVP